MPDFVCAHCRGRFEFEDSPEERKRVDGECLERDGEANVTERWQQGDFTLEMVCEDCYQKFIKWKDNKRAWLN